MRKLGLFALFVVIMIPQALVAESSLSGSKTLSADTATGLIEIELPDDNTSTGGTVQVVVCAKNATDTSVSTVLGTYEILRADNTDDVAFGGIVQYPQPAMLHTSDIGVAVQASLTRSLNTTTKKMTINVTATVLLGTPTQIIAYYTIRDITGKTLTGL